MARPDLGPQRSWTVSEPWIEFMIEAAKHYDRRDAATPFVDVVYLRPGYQCLQVSGNVPPHTDRVFPEWVYLLAFRADDAIMHCHGYSGIRLKPGILFEFNEHRRHRVEQPSSSYMIWTPLEVDRRLTFEEAMEGHRRQFNEGSNILLKGLTERQITSRRHRIVHDGRIMRAYDARNFCVAFLDRAGFCVAHEVPRADGAIGVEYPILTSRRPRLADWRRMADLLDELHDLTLPDEAMPRWLDGSVEAHR